MTRAQAPRSGRSLRTAKAVAVAALAAMLAGPAGAGILYSTDFEAFTAGNDRWVGTQGWIGNSTGVGAHGIDQDVIDGGGLGKTAFLGFNQPSATLVTVARQINYLPQPGDLPLVRVETLLGVQDSITKTARDSFFVSVYNSSGLFLAGIRFDNRPATYGIWRADGANPDHDTGIVFYRGELHLLSFTVDLPRNRWSAELLGPPSDPADPRPVVTIPLFVDAPFTATTRAVNFGLLAYEWQLGATATTGYGDNWLLVADTEVRSTATPIEPFRITSLTCVGGATTLVWPGQKGFDYQVEYSNDLATWYTNLPGSSFPAVAADQPLTFTDTTPGLSERFFRIQRAETP